MEFCKLKGVSGLRMKATDKDRKNYTKEKLMILSKLGKTIQLTWYTSGSEIWKAKNG